MQIDFSKFKFTDERALAFDEELSSSVLKEGLSEIPDEAYRLIKGKSVLVTGGGGTIGGALCAALVQCDPSSLTIFDVNENNSYFLYCTVKEAYPKADVHVEIGSVTDGARVCEVLSKYRPQIVFHAAAHKHVPLMESSPYQAVKNNVLGTLTLIEECERASVEKFVLISTDKAVDCASVMGATKRLCELMIASKKNQRTTFVAVRFGNVFASDGSVVPLFLNQIKKGGPITLTSQYATRYFMSVKSAVNLLIEALLVNESGKLLVLEMGQSINLLSLAKELIRLKSPCDIPIVITGLREGERLNEKRFYDSEQVKKITDKINEVSIAKVDEAQFLQDMDRLKQECGKCDINESKIKELLFKTIQKVGV